MFGKRKFLLAFLNNSELRLYSYRISGDKAERTDSGTVNFKDSIVKDSAILDFQGFQSEVATFFSQNRKLAGLPALLIVPEEKVFFKGFELDLGDLERKAFFRSEFLGEVPFEESELIVHERLVGRVIEFSAIQKRYIEEFRTPFLDQKMDVLGAVSVPQMMALELHPKERSFLMAFYDNDFVLALAENSSIIFSETHNLKAENIAEVMRAFDHFVLHLRASDIKSVSIILGEGSVEDALKDELERREYVIRELKKVNVLDMIAGYYDAHRGEDSAWNLVRTDKGSGGIFGRDYRNLIANAAAVILTLAVIGGSLWWMSGKLGFSLSGLFSGMKSQSPVPAAEAPKATTTPAVEAPVPPQKSDFPVQILNGTKLAGEAGRLKTLLSDRGFTVSSAGNNTDQNQAVTTIFVGDAPDAIISELRVILEARYQQVLVSPSPIMGKDIRVVIGKKLQL